MPHVLDFLTWLDDTSPSVFIRESGWAFPTIESIHVIAITLVVGTISIVDLRLLGFASTHRPVSELSHEVLPWTWGAFVVGLVAGTLMFISQPIDYYGNTAFRFKILIMLFAGINMLAFQLITYRGVSNWDREKRISLAGRIAGAVSLLCWIAVVFFGRRIGFTMFMS